ncbi:MAG: class I SAM-dependent methyltransferase [Erysipelotrichaceae bacterium]|nr:class I SAM-dependent methyltransferase [Erysipelotrichaceae bacterium]
MNNNTYVHKYIKGLIHEDDVCADMTAGNGFDTLFLASLAKKVYAFDISETAIRNTREKTRDCGNVILICDDHANLDSHIKEKIRLFLFNLGYLPHSDMTSVTDKDTTLTAFRKAYDLLEDNGYIVITFYLRHPGGRDEYYALDRYIRTKKADIIDIYRQDKKDSPITYIIKKSV